jgi:hypothetical protein
VNQDQVHDPLLHRPGGSSRAVVAAIADRIRRYNSDIDSRTDRFRAAVLLLASVELGQNIDVLSRRTGFDRCFVARCARRLIDNGVWLGGKTEADWSSADEASGMFWNDVAVAEGKMCRRKGPDGSVEWAPAGFWNKSFQFTDAEAAKRVDNVYRDAEPEVTPLASSDAPVESAPVQLPPPPPDEAVDPFDPEVQMAVDSRADLPASVPSLDRVFRDVIWIG